jgi:hypothetical protein
MFDMGHLFFIPILPMGFRNRWHCTICGSNPHERARTSKVLIGFLAVLVAVMVFLFWLPPLIPASEPATVWGFRFGTLAALAGLIYWLRISKPAPDLKEKLAGVQPLPNDKCIYCQGDLDRDAACPTCKVQRHQIGQYLRSSI